MDLADGPDVGPELSAAHDTNAVPSGKVDTQNEACKMLEYNIRVSAGTVI